MSWTEGWFIDRKYLEKHKDKNWVISDIHGDIRSKNNWLTDLLWGGFKIIFTFSLALKNITVMLVGWCEVWIHKYVYVLFKWGLNHFL